MKDSIQIKGTIVAVLTDVRTGEAEVHVTHNIVTNDGDLYYAERGVAQAIPTNFVDGAGAFDGIMELYDGASAAPAKGNNRSNLAGLISGSGQAMEAGYPKINDAEALNTGAGADVITYYVNYGTAEANGSTIADVIITNPSPGASEPVLMHAEFSSPFAKDATKVLELYINHSLTGV